MHRFVELFIALRYLRPRRNFVSVITVLSLLGVLLGVGVLIVVLSVMEGFEKELREKVVGFNAHVMVFNYNIMRDWEDVAEVIKQQPDVVAVSPFMTGPVLVQCNNQISTPFIRGVDAATIDGVLPIKQAVIGGELSLTPGAVIVGAGWATRHHAKVGDQVIVFSPRDIAGLLESPAKDAPQNRYLPSEYTISGIFSTGFYEYDANAMLINLAEGQRLYNLGHGVHGILVRTRDPMQAFALKETLRAKLPPPLQALTWLDQNAQLRSVAVERRLMAFVLFFVILVAALGLCSTLITVTVQKAREIGLMKALGAGDRQIVSIFTLYGLVVGVVGSALGVTFGCLVLAYRNEFSLWLGRVFHIDVFPPEVYHFMEIPAVTDGWIIFWIALSGVALSTAAALFPAFAALRVEPAAILHSE
ncbi:MAG: ABC transporter permease [Verrucomicrobiales bacterium]|jgi:lipoprotein-releasing system permease protein|nr:ABC transporter permease [Verrucomicrobiales bacterium]